MKRPFFALLLLATACQKNDVPLDPTLDIATWTYCHNLLDRETTLEKMVGNWLAVAVRNMRIFR